jgi:hypothetical protein
VILLDTLLVGGLRFVLAKIAEAVEAELDDEHRLREELLAAQMRLELGELAPAEFQALEHEVLERLRALRAEAGELRPGAGDVRIAGVEARAWDEE